MEWMNFTILDEVCFERVLLRDHKFTLRNLIKKKQHFCSQYYFWLLDYVLARMNKGK